MHRSALEHPARKPAFNRWAQRVDAEGPGMEILFCVVVDYKTFISATAPSGLKKDPR